MSDNNERYRKTVELQKLMRDPAAVQALIAENERLRVDLKSVVRLNNENADLFKAKNDQLKAENNRLKSAANTLARIGYRDHSGELWKPPIGQKPNFDLIDQLRAEVAGLKTGCEAYERVNAALRAEVEGLRKDAELHGQIQRAAGELPVGWEIRVCVEHESGYVELWDQDGCEVDFPNSCESLGLTVSDAIDAALGQGEQS